jgi:hypothetical protein
MCRLEENIGNYLVEMRRPVMEWIHLAEYKYMWSSVVSTVMDILFYKIEKCLQ